MLPDCSQLGTRSGATFAVAPYTVDGATAAVAPSFGS